MLGIDLNAGGTHGSKTGFNDGYVCRWLSNRRSQEKGLGLSMTAPIVCENDLVAPAAFVWMMIRFVLSEGVQFFDFSDTFG